MIYEIRTYDLTLRSAPEFEKRFGEKLPGRQEFSQLGGLWHTEVGPLHQVVHIWPYDDLNQREEVRNQAVASGKWGPDAAHMVVNAQSEIFKPAPFMHPLGNRDIGPIYEMRTYTFPTGAMSGVLEAWAERIEHRETFSPLAGCWYSELGGLNKFVHLWAYKSFAERNRVRDESRKGGLWPPSVPVMPVKQENKILIPAECSPMQ